MESSKFLTLSEELFELSPGTLSRNSVIEDTPGWGSLAFLGLIALIDEQFGLTIRPRQLNRCVTFGDLCELLFSMNSNSLAA